MCFPRNPSLGRYSASREEWANAYREARVWVAQGHEPNPISSGVEWKAQLIVAYERSSHDKLSFPVQSRLEFSRLIDELLDD